MERACPRPRESFAAAAVTARGAGWLRLSGAQDSGRCLPPSGRPGRLGRPVAACRSAAGRSPGPTRRVSAVTVAWPEVYNLLMRLAITLLISSVLLAPAYGQIFHL